MTRQEITNRESETRSQHTDNRSDPGEKEQISENHTYKKLT